MRRWYSTWMTVNLRPDARFQVTLAPLKHLTTDLRTMPKPTLYTHSSGTLNGLSWALLIFAAACLIGCGAILIHLVRHL